MAEPTAASNSVPTQTCLETTHVLAAAPPLRES
jgi:hypothetical protein